MSDKLIKELMLKVNAKGLGPAAKNLENIANNLENAAAGAELLDGALKPIPESLKDIVREAEDVEQIFKSLGKGNDTDRLEEQFDNLDNTLNEILGSILQFHDAVAVGMGGAAKGAGGDISELIHVLERMEDSAELNARQANALKKQLVDLGSAGEKTNRNIGRLSKGQGAMARGFSDIAKFAGPIPGLYAVIAANVYALTEAFRVLSEGDQLNRLEKVGTVLGAKVGVPIQNIARAMQEATGYTVSYEQALRQASAASTYGFSSDQIVDMTKAARRASVALGVDMTDAMNRIIRGVSKLEIELLDELGITVRLTEAYENYAATIGKTATELTGYQKQQAYLQAVLKESEKRQGEVDVLAQATGWERLGAAVSGAADRGKQFLAEFLAPTAVEFAKIFEDDIGDRIIKKTEDVINTLEAAKNSGKRGSYVLSAAGVSEDDIRELEARVSLVGRQILSLQKVREEANASGRGTSNMTANERSLRAEFEQQVLLLGKMRAALSQANQELNVMDDTQLNAKASAYQALIAWSKNTEELTKAESAVKGSAESYEILFSQLGELATIQKEFAASGEDVATSWESAGITEEAYNRFVSLQKLMQDLHVSTNGVAEASIRLSESDRSKGILEETTALRQQNLRIALVEKELALYEFAKANQSKLSEIETRRNILLLERSALLREQEKAILDNGLAAEALATGQKQFQEIMSNTTTEYERQKELVVQELLSTQKQLDLAIKHNEPLTERLSLEERILAAKRKSLELDRAELQNRFSLQTDALSTGQTINDTGPLESMAKQIQLAEQQTQTAKEMGAAYHEVYLERLKREIELKAQLARAEEDDQARLNNLFLARTAQQDLINMNTEQQLEYHQQVGAAMYESARSALDAFDPAMGAMFDGLQQFTVALMQVGETSESVWNSVAAGIQAAASVMNFASQQAIQQIDKQIAAEKKKDGQTEASRKKIAQLEAKKAKETEKQQRAAIIANTAVGIMSAISTAGNIYAGLALAAVVAAMGAMQLSALDSGSISDPGGSAGIGKLELGSRENVVNVGQGANSGELAYIRGQQGVGGIQDFVPRARGGSISPNVGYGMGEHGMEAKSGGSSISSNEDVMNSFLTARKTPTLQLSVSALDAQSIIDRASEIFAAVEAEANARGFTLTSTTP